MKNKNKKKYGYTLIEIVFYISLFTMLSVVLLQALVMMTGLFLKTMINNDISQGSAVVENITREIRKAENFSFSSNTLNINTKDLSGENKIITYTLLDSNIQITDSLLGDLGNLNPSSISITNFNVSPINTTRGKAAKLNISIKSNKDKENNVESFQNTIKLRGSY